MGEFNKNDKGSEKSKILKKITKNKKFKFLVIPFSIIVICIISYNYYGIGMSNKTKQDKIMNLLSEKKYEKSRKLTRRYFNDKMEKDYLSLIDLFQDADVGTKEEYLAYMDNKTNQLKQELSQQIQNDVNQVYIENLKQANDKYTAKATFNIVNPTNRYITYMEMSINYLDDNSNVISSGFTNESNIMANSKRLKEIYLSAPDGTKSFNVEVINVTFK